MQVDLMTTAEIQEHFGGVSESYVRTLMSQNGIKCVSGYPRDQVMAIKRPGAGARTDLRRTNPDGQ